MARWKQFGSSKGQFKQSHRHVCEAYRASCSRLSFARSRFFIVRAAMSPSMRSGSCFAHSAESSPRYSLHEKQHYNRHSGTVNLRGACSLHTQLAVSNRGAQQSLVTHVDAAAVQLR